MIKNFITLTTASGDEYTFSNFRDVTSERELDDVISSMSFSTAIEADISKIISKYDYFEYFVLAEDDSSYSCQFRGYIDKKLKRKSKTTRTITWVCLDKLSRFNRVNMKYVIDVTNLKRLTEALTIAAEELLPGFLTFDLRMDGSEIILRSVEPSLNILEHLRSIREKTAMYVYYDPVSDSVVITTPTFLQYEYRNHSLPVYEFDSKINMLGTFDYGDVSSDINCIEYIGISGRKGIAVDFLNYGQNNQIRKLTRYDNSTDSKEELERQARNELLDIMRSHSMSFSIPLNKASLAIEIGSLCTINDHDEFNNDRFFIINKKSITVKKDDIIINLTVRAGTLVDFPEDLVLQEFGITDESTLEVNEKISGELL